MRLVDEVFARLKAIFGSQKVGGMFAQADAEVVLAEWQQALERHDRDAVHRALNLLATEGGQWPPTLPALIERVAEVRGEPMHRPALPVPDRTAADLARGREQMDRIKAMLGGAFKRRDSSVMSREPGIDDEAPPPLVTPACTCWTGTVRAPTLCPTCAARPVASTVRSAA